MGNFAYLQITRLCNQCCIICSNPENPNSISFEKGIGFVDSLIEDGGFEGVILTGGEPTICDDLPRYLQYCNEKNFPSVLITNGQRMADPDYVKLLKDSGLKKVVLSLYSKHPQIQGLLTGNIESLANLEKAAHNIEEIGDIELSITMTICRNNADHLSKNVEYIIQNFKSINHVVFNNLDPLMNRASEHQETIPMLNDIDIELTRSVEILKKEKMTFRIERVPLCYMCGYEHNSTETRRIVKEEKCRLLFLDEKGEVDKREGDRFYGKAECCKICYLNDICIGLYSMDIHYMSKELFPIFHITKEEVIEKVLSNAI